MTQSWAGFQQRIQQIAQHLIVDTDLLFVAPAFDQSRQLEQRGIDQMGHAGQPADHHLGIAPRRSDRAERTARETTRAASVATEQSRPGQDAG
jgi:hypothetical protein